MAAEPASAERVLAQIAALRPGPGEGCLVFVTSHGQRGEGIWLAYSGEFLRPAELARALSAGCARAPTVVIVSGCFTGGFTSVRAPNRIVVTASRADRPSFGCAVERTYAVFDECLLASLPRAATWRLVIGATQHCVREREGEMQGNALRAAGDIRGQGAQPAGPLNTVLRPELRRLRPSRFTPSAGEEREGTLGERPGTPALRPPAAAFPSACGTGRPSSQASRRRTRSARS